MTFQKFIKAAWYFYHPERYKSKPDGYDTALPFILQAHADYYEADFQPIQNVASLAWALYKKRNK